MNIFKLTRRYITSNLQLKNNFYTTVGLSKKLNEELFDQISTEDREYLNLSERHFKLEPSKNCFIIQPYVKWGPQKLQGITPNDQLEEAKALIKTLPSWSIYETISIPLESFDKKNLFGSGTLEKLRQKIRRTSLINAIFINLSTLKKSQFINLEKDFNVQILDRYKVVMLILKLHAVSKHAKLQVALAELYYLQHSTINDQNFCKIVNEKMKLMFQAREQKLKNAIKELRIERQLQRNKRQKIDFPVIAVVGYTNSGKTSLIKALTAEEKLQPKNQLFATLDVTMHQGLLPSGLKVLYVDTVGFISDIPTSLIECFVATLEDAILADVILHVEDLSSTCFEFKRRHVLETLDNLSKKSGCNDIMNKMISVGNKSDLIEKNQDFGILKVSSKTETGLDALRIKLEEKILDNTNMKKIKIRVPTGGDSIRWLYKNSTVISETSDDYDPQYVLASVLISDGKLQQFKRHFS